MAIAMTPNAVAEEIGEKYVETDRLPYEDSRKAEILYGNIGAVCKMLESRIPVPVEYQPEDPYSSYEDMARTVAEEQKLRVYNKHNNHRFFSKEENLAFRAVHDWYGHLSADVDFSVKGEFQKFEHMSEHFRPEENKVMFAEVVGQRCAIHYLNEGFASDRYEQRAFIAPKTWIRKMRKAVESTE